MSKAPGSNNRVWRMNAETPRGEYVDSSPMEANPETASGAKVIQPARVPSWRASSHDLLVGASVTEVTDTIPGELFDELFKDSR